MYTLIIAEDEHTIAEGIRKMVERRCPEIRIDSVCKNGQQVIDIIKKSPVDIIIADINMPIATGIDIAKFVYESNQNTQIILITGYQQFQYVYDAINYHVCKFLSKPFKVNDLIDAIKSAEKEVDNFRSSLTLKNENTLLALNNYRVSLSGLYNNLTVSKLSEDFEKTISGKLCYEVKLQIDNLDGYLATQNVKKRNIDTAITDLCEYYFGDNLSLCVDINGNIFTFVLFTSDKNFLDEYLEHLKKGLHLFYNFELFVEYEEFSDIDELLSNKKYRKTADELYRIIMGGDLNYINRYTEALILQNETKELKNIAKSILEQCKKRQSQIYENFYSKILFSEQHEEISEILRNLISEIYFALFNNKELTASVIKYIANNFTEDLSIENIANNIGVSPAYLGKVFKNEKGEKLVNYIINFRIGKAKELLKKTNTPIREIGRMVGYNSINYFSKIFKKETGLSLSAYRTACRKNEWN